MNNVRPEFKHRTLTLEFDHNPYEVSFYNLSSIKDNGTIIFPIFHYEGFRQYYDLLAPIINKGYKVIVVNLLTKNDRVLFFNYYFQLFSRIVHELVRIKLLLKEEKITLMGFGLGAYLVSYCQIKHLVDANKMILISPINHYHDEFQISRFISQIDIPTFIHFGQSDSVVNEDDRFRIYKEGHLNPLIHFSSYPISGHYLYYKDILSVRLENIYKDNNYNFYIGDTNKYKTSALPEIVVYNEQFFAHLFNELDDKPNKKRICLLTDVFPLFINGVNVVVDLLKKELEKLNYEVYVAALWNNKISFKQLPDDHYIPIRANYAYFLKGHRELEMFETLNFTKQAKLLAPFGFDYLHLHTEYSMGQIALRLSKYTGVKLLYTYHTLWNLYYQQKFGKLMGDITYKAAKRLLFTKIYKSCEIITVPSKKSYDLLKEEYDRENIRIIPSAINVERFNLTKEDSSVIKELKEQYKLKDKKVLGYVGRVSLEKNIIETLDYISKVKTEIPNLVFMIVGVGDAVASLKKAAEKYHLEDSIIFIGEVENSKLKYYYALFDVFVTASNFETQGLTYFESAASGTVILAKKDRAIEDIFVDKENAYIYSTFNEWKERLELALFKNNADIIKNAKKLMNKYASDKWAKEILSIYQELNPERK